MPSVPRGTKERQEGQEDREDRVKVRVRDRVRQGDRERQAKSGVQSLPLLKPRLARAGLLLPFVTRAFPLVLYLG